VLALLLLFMLGEDDRERGLKKSFKIIPNRLNRFKKCYLIDPFVGSTIRRAGGAEPSRSTSSLQVFGNLL
jgi:hypothetical protein